MPFSIDADGRVTVTGDEELNDFTSSAHIVRQVGSHRVYVISAITVAAGATLTIDPELATLEISGASTATGSFNVEGTLNIGIDEQNYNSTNVAYSLGEAIKFTSTATSQPWREWSLKISPTGTLNWRGGDIISSSSIAFQAGSTINIFEGRVALTAENFQVRIFTSGNILNFYVKKFPVLLFTAQTNLFLRIANADFIESGRNSASITFYGSATGATTNTLPIRINDYDSAGGVNDVNLLDGAVGVLRNSVKGSSNLVKAWLTGGQTNRRQGVVTADKDMAITILDVSGAALENVKVFNRDATGVATTTETEATGVATFNQMIAQWTFLGNESGGTVAPVVRGNSNDEFVYVFNLYGFLQSEITLSARGAGTLNASIRLFDDPQVMQKNPLITAAKTHIVNADCFGDVEALYRYENFTGQDRYSTKAGTTIFSPHNIHIVSSSHAEDATAVFSYSMATDTITIISDLFDGNFVLPTTKTVTLDGAEVSGSIIDSVGNSVVQFDNVESFTAYNSPTDRTNGTNEIGTGVDRFRFNFTTARTYYFDCIISDTHFFADVRVTHAGVTMFSLAVQSLLSALRAQNRADFDSISGLIQAIPTDATPTSTQVAAAVRTSLSPELARIDVPISSRALPMQVPTRVEIATTVAGLLQIPTTAQIATAIRTDLTTELARIDVPISSRALPMQVPTRVEIAQTVVGLLQVPTTADIAAAVFNRAFGAQTFAELLQIIFSTTAGRNDTDTEGRIIFYDNEGNATIRATINNNNRQIIELL